MSNMGISVAHPFGSDCVGPLMRLLPGTDSGVPDGGNLVTTALCSHASGGSSRKPLCRIVTGRSRACTPEDRGAAHG